MQFSPRMLLPLMAVHATVCLVQGPVAQMAKNLDMPSQIDRSVSPLPPLPPIVSRWLRSR
ncbi:MAG: hypothetical protein HC860_02590 [Alkalinema sp. RU_4_3]|nr:hypothetical protein [Alkalinema sp. RU_4_3]